MDLVDAIRACFVAAAATVVAVSYVPILSSRFLAYGARSSPRIQQSFVSGEQKVSTIDSLLDYCAAIQVPHSWFAAFYLTSVTLSLIWASDYLLPGPLIRLAAAYLDPSRPSMTLLQVYLGWMCVFVQGSRRVYESISFTGSSQSTMWIGHWALGEAFYVGLSVAVWIEGTAVLRRSDHADLNILGQITAQQLLALALFAIASTAQYICHAHLYSLRNKSPLSAQAKTSRYSLPQHPLFRYTHTPHYFAECLIYTALTVLTAPAGQFANQTMLCATVFVVVNLGVTASGTSDWYEKTFGKAATRGRARMVPFLY